MTNETILSEAILFFILFGSMFVTSFFISKKQAKSYELAHPLQDRKDATRDRLLIERYLNSSSTKIRGKNAVLLELSKLLKKHTINEQEYKILKDSLIQ